MKYVLLLLICFLVLGCKDDKLIPEHKTLLKQANELREENRLLKDSLSRYEEEFLQSQIIIGIPDQNNFKVGKKNNIKLIMHTHSRDIPKYEIFRIDNDKEVKIGTGTKTMFEYEFIPKDLNDNELNLKIKVPFKDRFISIPAAMEFQVSK